MIRKVIVEHFIKDKYDESDLKAYIHAKDLALCLSEVDNVLFRPYFKHGYNDKSMEELSQDLPEDKDGNTIIDLLRARFQEMLDDYGINIEDMIN